METYNHSDENTSQEDLDKAEQERIQKEIERKNLDTLNHGYLGYVIATKDKEATSLKRFEDIKDEFLKIPIMNKNILYINGYGNIKSEAPVDNIENYLNALKDWVNIILGGLENSEPISDEEIENMKKVTYKGSDGKKHYVSELDWVYQVKGDYTETYIRDLEDVKIHLAGLLEAAQERGDESTTSLVNETISYIGDLEKSVNL